MTTFIGILKAQAVAAAQAFNSAAEAVKKYEGARRGGGTGVRFGADAIDEQFREIQRGAAAVGGTGIGGAGGGGFITVAYAEQLVIAYAALLSLLATPNLSPFAYSQATRDMGGIEYFWNLLGFGKYGSVDSLARAKTRGGAGGKKPTPGAIQAKPPASSIPQQQGNGSLRW